MNTLAFDPAKYLYRDTTLPTISGTSAERNPRTKVEITIGKDKVFADFDAKTGKFSWTAPTPLPEGHYNIAIVIIDAAGNHSTPLIRTMIIDTTPPEAPELINLRDDVGAEQGSFDPGKITDDARPTLTGTAQPGSVVYLRDAMGNNIGSAKADTLTGKWVIEPDNDLPQGENALTLVAVEEFGNDAKGDPIFRTGTPSDAFIINVASAEFVTLDGAIDNSGSWTGALNSGALTDDSTPALHGKVNTGETVTVYFRKAGESSWSGSATATVNGENWSWTPSTAFNPSHYEFQARSSKSSSAVFDLDIIAVGSGDQQTIITQVWDDVGIKTGALNSGDFTDDSAPEFSGRAEANSRVVIQYTQGASVNSVTVNVGSNGVWKWTPAADLTDGDWNFQVKTEGATSWNNSFELHIYPSPSVATTITQLFDDVGTTGFIANNGDTDDNTPTLSGRTEAGKIVEIWDGRIKLGSAQANASGDWSFTSSALGDGHHNFIAVQQGYSGVSNTWQVNIDTSSLVPEEPKITALYEAQDDGSFDKFGNNGIINNGTVKVEGTGRSGSTVNIYDGSKVIGSAIVGNDGKWSYIHPDKYIAGSHSITATTVQSGGSESAHSNKVDFTLVGDGSGSTGDGYYIQGFGEHNTQLTGKIVINPGFVFRSNNGGKAIFKLIDGFLGGKDNDLTKDQPGALKTLDDRGEVTFAITPSIDFNMAVYGFNDPGITGRNYLSFYDTTGKFLGSQYFNGTDNSVYKSASFFAPKGTLISKVVLNYDDAGGIAIAGVNYGTSSLKPNSGSEYFNGSPGYFASIGYGPVDPNVPGDITGLAVTSGSAQHIDNHYVLDPDDLFGFTVGRTTDIHFDLISSRVVFIEFYDAFGKKLHSGFYTNHVDYEAPAGEFIFNVVIDPLESAGIALDNVIWGNKLGDIDYGYDSNNSNAVALTHDDSVALLNGLVNSAAIVDLHDGQATTIEIALDDIMAKGEMNLFIEDDTRQLMIQGDANDVVKLQDILPNDSDIASWTLQNGTITVAGMEYKVYSHNGEAAEVLVQSDLKVDLH